MSTVPRGGRGMRWWGALALAVLVVGRASPASTDPLAYITNLTGNSVSVLDTATNTVVATVPVGIAPVGVAVNSAGTRVYVANLNSGTVSVLDTATNAVVATIPVGIGPYGVAVNPGGTRVYVANIYSDTVSVLSTATNTVVATVLVGTAPVGVAVNSAGTRVYVTDEFDGTVSVLDTATNTVVATVPVGSGPYGVAVNPAGTRVYVANHGASTVSVLDTATNTVVASVPVGSGPFGVAVNPAGTRVYVANETTNSVSVLDTVTNAVVATVPVGIGPYGLAINPAGTRVYAANLYSNTVSGLDTATNTVVATVPIGTAPVAFGMFIQQAPGSCVPPPSGMVAWWPMDETSGVIIRDMAGSPNLGLAPLGFSQGSSVPGMVRGALSFNGSSRLQVLNVPRSLDFGTGDLSIDAWVHQHLPNGNENGEGGIIVDKVDDAANAGYALFIKRGYVSFQFGASTTYTSNPLPFIPGQWHHIAVTLDRTSAAPALTFYLDGAVVGSFGNLSSAALTSQARLTIGGPLNSLISDIAIDELDIFNRALSGAEVQSIFNAGSLGKCS